MPGHSTIHQLLSIISTIYDSFENYDETRAGFRDNSKAFDKVWHEGLVYKLKFNGGGLSDFFESHLSIRHQCEVINGKEFDWIRLNASVHQGSVLGPLLFPLYINNLTDDMFEISLFSDDSFLFACVNGIDCNHDKSVKDLRTIATWAQQWKKVFNPDLTKQAIEAIFLSKDKKPVHPNLTFNKILITREPYTKHLGVYLDTRFNFGKHIKENVLKAVKE